MIPGSNVLSLALRAIGPQTVTLYRFASRSIAATGREVSVYAPPVTVRDGSVQPVPRMRYAAMGLDLTRSYVTWFTSAAVRGVERDRAPDVFVFGGRRYDVTSVTAWNLQDGWNEITGVDVGPATEVPPVTVNWLEIEGIPSNVSAIEALTGAGPVQRLESGTIETIETIRYVKSAEDLPAPVAGIITLAANVTYKPTTSIVINGARIQGSPNSVIEGSSSENCALISTGLAPGVPFISSAYSLPIRDVTLTAETLFDLDAAGNPGQVLDWRGVNFVNCPSLGRIANYANFVFETGAFFNSSGLVFDGTFGTVALFQSLLSGVIGETILSFAPTFVATRRVRVLFCAVPLPAGATGIYVDPAASIPTEKYILYSVDFGSTGTPIAGVSYVDNRARFVDCVGVTNTAQVASYSMNENATPTVIAASGTAVKIAGSTVGGAITQKFTLTDNRATFVGGFPRTVVVSAVLSVGASAQNLQLEFTIAKNGLPLSDSTIRVTTNSANRAESVAVQCVVAIAPGDYLEVWGANLTNADDFTVTSLNFLARTQA